MFHGAVPLDESKMQTFARQNLMDLAGMCATVLSIWGDRLGLFKALNSQGPATSGELAAQTSISERYAREWLCGMAGAGYLEYDPATQRFGLPPEHAPILAQEAALPFRGGLYHFLPSWLKRLDEIEAAFRSGNGVPQELLADENFWKGYESATVRPGMKTSSFKSGYRLSPMSRLAWSGGQKSPTLAAGAGNGCSSWLPPSPTLPL
jgi:hypothetical protein